MRYYLGIDGGGSKTTCVVGDDVSVIATATAGASNVVRVGEAQARASLHTVVQQACAAARITAAQVSHTCVGAAGAARPEIAGIVRRALAEILQPPIEVVGDMEIALQAAFDSGPGIVVIAGTGSIAFGRDAKGAVTRTGGWGFAVSDEGSAHWIGRHAISAVLRATDEQGSRGHSDRLMPLARHLVKVWSVTSVEDLASGANAVPPPDFAALFPAVLETADSGDAMAREVLTHAGVELAHIAEIAIRRLFPPESTVPLAMAGGVFRHAALVREVFYNEIRKRQPRIELNSLVIDPVDGALRLARRAVSRTAGAD